MELFYRKLLRRLDTIRNNAQVLFHKLTTTTQIKEPTKMKILNNHITHKSGERKTICVTAVLSSLGIDSKSFHYTGSLADNRRNAILNRNGFACRSRLSRIGRDTSIGKARAKIASLKEGSDVKYMVSVRYGRSAHLMLLDNKGNTLVDTDPRKVDKRRIAGIHAVWKS